jgi:hypothetical protein
MTPPKVKNSTVPYSNDKEVNEMPNKVFNSYKMINQLKEDKKVNETKKAMQDMKQ